MMDAKELEWFRSRLLEQKASLTSPPDGHNVSLFSQEGGDSLDASDQANRSGEDLVVIRLRNDRANLLRKLDFALERLDDGTYGTCTACGKTIPRERLRAKPSVSLCISCQDKKDHQREHDDG